MKTLPPLMIIGKGNACLVLHESFSIQFEEVLPPEAIDVANSGALSLFDLVEDPQDTRLFKVQVRSKSLSPYVWDVTDPTLGADCIAIARAIMQDYAQGRTFDLTAFLTKRNLT